MSRLFYQRAARLPGVPGLVVLVAAILVSGCGTQLTESYTAGDSSESTFKLGTNSARVVLMPLDIELTELTATGLKEPKAAWTETARRHVTNALAADLNERNMNLVNYRKPKSAKRLMRDDQLTKLHSQVGGTILVHHYNTQGRLATKKGRMDWTLGSTARQLGKDQKAQFALFVFLRDTYATGGRKAAVAVSAIFGTGARGDERVGFASLVDLRTGNVVWFNFLYSDRGDIRKAEAARNVIEDLLNGFPA